MDYLQEDSAIEAPPVIRLGTNNANNLREFSSEIMMHLFAPIITFTVSLRR